MNVRSLLLLPVALLALTGCGSSDAQESAPATSATATSPTAVESSAPSSPTAAPEGSGASTTSEQVTKDIDPTGDLAAQLKDRFPGYPVLVDASTLDESLAYHLEYSKITGKVVALVPGVYTAYNENIPDLDKYYKANTLFGDSMMAQEYLPNSGGTFPHGVMPGSQEPTKAVPPAAEDPDSAKATDLKQEFPGYPVLVDVASIDERVVRVMESSTEEGKAVAVAPGLYAAYHPHFPDLEKYYDVRTFYGDDMMHQQYLPDTGGSFPYGVKAGTQEPQS